MIITTVISTIRISIIVEIAKVSSTKGTSTPKTSTIRSHPRAHAHARDATRSLHYICGRPFESYCSLDGAMLRSVQPSVLSLSNGQQSFQECNRCDHERARRESESTD